jgi:hypothetical protein
MIKVDESAIKRVNFKSPGWIWGMGSYGIRLIKIKVRVSGQHLRCGAPSWRCDAPQPSLGNSILKGARYATHQLAGATHLMPRLHKTLRLAYMSILYSF